MNRRRHALLWLAILIPSIACAQDAPTAPCEIHVWPSARLNSLTEGAILNNVLDSAITPHGGRVTERAVPRTALDPEEQRAHLRAIDFAALLRAPGAVVTVHSEVSQRRVTGPPTGRQTASTAACYRELTIAKIFFSRSGLGSRNLRTLAIYDDFGAQPLSMRTFIGWAATPLKIFPAKQPESEAAAAAELAAAFKANITQFSGYVFAEPRKK